MFISIEEVENNSTLNSDVCIIGGGPAGITLAKELEKFNVILIEGGELEFSEKSQNLYKGSIAGNPKYRPDLDICRLRYWGGTSNHWGGWCAPLSKFDFERKDYNPGGEWPISYEKDYLPYLDEACNYCDIEKFNNQFEKEIDNSSKLLKSYWHFSKPTLFGEKFFTDFKKNQNLKIIYGANFYKFTETNGEVKTSSFISYDKNKIIKLSSKIFILCCGGMENARILLSQKLLYENNSLKAHNMIGKSFQEHIAVGRIAEIIPFNQIDKSMFNFVKKSYLIKNYKNYDDLFKLTSNYRQKNKLKKQIRFSLKPSHLLKQNTLNTSFLFEEHIKNDVKTIDLTPLTEQSVNKLSRISLDKDTDELGMRKIKFNWNLTTLDKSSIFKNLKLFGEEMARLGYGRLKMNKIYSEFIDGWGSNTGGGAHHMCTTKMSDNIKKGVVDSNCKLFKTSNFFIAGSSVFPSGGSVNPTLSIVALSIRLSKHLKKLLT